jgi:hypothetical protein
MGLLEGPSTYLIEGSVHNSVNQIKRVRPKSAAAQGREGGKKKPGIGLAHGNRSQAADSFHSFAFLPSFHSIPQIHNFGVSAAL